MDENRQLLGISETATNAEIRKAYRELARKWHPDRFPEGPERVWAEQKMVEINRAYNACVSHAVPPSETGSDGKYGDVRFLIEAGQLSRARKILRSMETRDAEWNYQFGRLLYERREYEKAILFLRIAVRQAPGNHEYARALETAEAFSIHGHTSVISRLRHLLQRKAI